MKYKKKVNEMRKEKEKLQIQVKNSQKIKENLEKRT
jgi:hypothetical protein